MGTTVSDAKILFATSAKEWADKHPAGDGEAAPGRPDRRRAQLSSAPTRSTDATGARSEHHPFLHFELCYYQAIEAAIERRLARVEAGAQGEHKLARGYLPVPTYSAHFIAEPHFRRAVADYLKRERAYVEEMGRDLLASAPFRRNAVPEEIED